MRRSYYVEELLRKCGGVTPLRSYSVNAELLRRGEELLRKCGGITPLRSYSVNAELLRKCGGVTP